MEDSIINVAWEAEQELDVIKTFNFNVKGLSVRYIDLFSNQSIKLFESLNKSL